MMLLCYGCTYRQPPANGVGETERVGRPGKGTGRAFALPPGFAH